MSSITHKITAVNDNKPKYKYRFYVVYGYKYPSELIPNHIQPLLIGIDIRKHPTVGEPIFVSGYKQVIIKRGLSISFWYPTIGEGYINIYKEPVNRLLMQADKYKDYYISISDISNISSRREIPIPYFSAAALVYDKRIVSNDMSMHLFLDRRFISEVSRCYDCIEEPEYEQQIQQQSEQMTEQEKEEDAIKMVLSGLSTQE